ncbi:MAG: protein translocase subunit SecD [Gammaproteobacteria bacterium]|nr:protein translocase subunit SecD [Gammaproteobacteria bacterium]MCY4218248.1 protein translocase subunit SecD [Gammaproteobacteria bacterium]MCY4273793.1 protein translocase subunit SecD [Gammaproteobacteria bacterium]
MLNQTEWWRYLIVTVVVAVGIFYSIPNLFGSDPGIQIRGARGLSLNSNLLGRVETVLIENDLEFKSLSQDQNNLKIHFDDTTSQLKAKKLLESELGNAHSLALTLLPNAPDWMSEIGALPMYLGLDLRGGVHFLLQVDMDSAIQRQIQNAVDGIRSTLREERIRYRRIVANEDGTILADIRNLEQREEAADILKRDFQELQVQNSATTEGALILSLRSERIDEIREAALEQNRVALRNRVDQLGVAEPIVQQQGADRIIVQLPGVQDTARAKEILGRAATLEMRMVDEENNAAALEAGQSPPGSRLYRFRDGRRILLEKRVIYSGDNIIDAAASLDQNGGPIVSITLDSTAATINSRITGENIGNRMAVVYQEIVSRTRTDDNGNPILNDEGLPERITDRIEEVLTAPVIRAQLGKRYQIEGIGSINEARDLALMLRAGALAAPVEIIEERTVGPSLGQANIDQGMLSVIVGLILVMIFMIMYYRIFGVVALISLSMNLVLIVSVLSLLQATLTLPGVAGIVLTVGMAVDANVLIFERIREEIRNGNTPQASIHLGYDRALSTIVDANITTLIAALVLFNFGTGPIKGFAVTLSIGILTSMFTAILLSRVIVNGIYGGKIVKRLSI